LAARRTDGRVGIPNPESARLHAVVANAIDCPVDYVASRTLFMACLGMDYEIDKIHPEDEGDGLPNIQWRLRIIVAAILGGAAVWVGFIFLI